MGYMNIAIENLHVLIMSIGSSLLVDIEGRVIDWQVSRMRQGRI